jgi:hypothetical protein
VILLLLAALLIPLGPDLYMAVPEGESDHYGKDRSGAAVVQRPSPLARRDDRVRVMSRSSACVLRRPAGNLEAAIGNMKPHGRIAVCGMISGYNDRTPQPGPSNLFELVARRITMQGFLVMDYAAQFGNARRELEAWLASGQLRGFEDIQEGFENIPKTFMRIFAGDNIGKQMLKIADPD